MNELKWVGWTFMVVAVLMIGYGAKVTFDGGNSDGNCYAEIEWVDFLMLDDIMYTYNGDGTKEASAAQQGEKVGEVAYMLSDHACTVMCPRMAMRLSCRSARRFMKCRAIAHRTGSLQMARCMK